MAITDAPKCQHRQEDGTHCQRPARRRLRLCDFHHREHKRNAKRIAERARQRWFESVAFDEPKSVQKALAQVMQRLLRGEIDNHRAGQLLHKLQTAAVDLAGKRTEMRGQEMHSASGGGVIPHARVFTSGMRDLPHDKCQ